MLIGVVIPVVIRQSIFGLPFYVTTQFATILGSAIAIILGYIGYRRMLLFPGISSGGYVITYLTITFSALVLIMFVLRLDYSRLQVASCYTLSVATLLFIHLKFERSREFLFSYVPGGLVEDLPRLPHVRWHRIETPEMVLKGEDAVVVDLHADHDPRWESAIAKWVLAGIPLYDARLAKEQLTGRVEINHLYENTLGSLNPNNVLLKMKSVVDFFMAALLIIIFMPFMAVIAAMIKIDSKGPAIFKQKRMGFRASPFTVYKFRTMFVASETHDVETLRQSAMTKDGDVRITKFGRLLRRTRLDELPQLFNILKGDMSLIGPRPEAVALSEWYESQIPFYHYRHIIKPGLTGWAQVNQGHVTDVTDVREKLNLDFYYVKNYSIWLDMLIALRTIAIVFTGIGAR
ncbi:sugar transferase [Sphingomonas radiodurans]|uniref:sugar transferase n=1 Tax=Sphingomonas radiodurans TaxID=2890321 RepID=UPI001E41B925|nr:sugar transferase [Sphingomonas radiodurans]WBH15092.1 sugar transferase [Sphingomonas radiodurans]